MAGDVKGPGGSIKGKIWKTIGVAAETHPGPTWSQRWRQSPDPEPARHPREQMGPHGQSG